MCRCMCVKKKYKIFDRFWFFLGQKKIKDSSVLIVGAGGLGCPAALYLTCAGVGCIGIVDYDDVEINNLHRQLLYTEISVGTAKVIAAMESLNRYIVL